MTMVQTQILLYFIYGLSFYTLGITAFSHKSLKNTKNPILTHLPYLGLFALLHCIVEWIQLLSLLEIFAQPSLITTFNQLLVIFSFSILLIFGLSLHTKTSRYKFLIPSFLYAIWLLFYFFFSPSIAFSIGLGRYFISFPASLFVSYGFYKNGLISKQYQNKLLTFALYSTSFLFFCYSIFSGLLVPKSELLFAPYLNSTSFYELFSIQVEYIRTCIAFLLSISFYKVVDLSILEAEYKIQSLSTKTIEKEVKLELSQILHDGVIQNLFACGLLLEQVPMSEETNLIKSTLQGAILDIRNFIEKGKEEESSSLYVRKLQTMISSYQKGTSIQIVVEELPMSLEEYPLDLVKNLYYIVNELCSNSIKHAKATKIRIKVTGAKTKVWIEVEDNGSYIEDQKGFGLPSIAHRVTAYKGSFEITKSATGTLVKIGLEVF